MQADSFTNSTGKSTTSTNSMINAFVTKMREAALPDECIATFKHYYHQLVSNQNLHIPENAITPIEPDTIVNYESILPHINTGSAQLPYTAVIKLNGGLGTTMGCEGPKSLITIKNGHSFLEIIIRGLIHANTKYSASIPLILMNSFSTEADSLSAIDNFPEIKTKIPASFLQHKFPKILASTLGVAQYPDNPELEWNPPGHGDLFLALMTSGLLDTLLDQGFNYAFISNSDNVNASPDPAILGYMASATIDFLMEVAERTPADQKGGHIAMGKDGSYILREIKQCPDEDLPFFEDIQRHRFFNTNNLWINLVSLKALITKNSNQINLPMVCNQKSLNPIDSSSPPVYQLESAMGSIISLFNHSSILCVPRSRFMPVKSIKDYMLIKSDLFRLTPEYTLVEHPGVSGTLPDIHLDPSFFNTVADIDTHFASGVPSLLQCKSLKVSGNVVFGKNISCIGDVEITNTAPDPVFIADNKTLQGSYTY